jgi:hypothetical protein
LDFTCSVRENGGKRKTAFQFDLLSFCLFPVPVLANPPSLYKENSTQRTPKKTLKNHRALFFLFAAAFLVRRALPHVVHILLDHHDRCENRLF